MRNSILLSIPKPCAKQWSNFIVTPHGGFCGSCSKTVIDFTTMSDAEIHNFFSKKSEGTCGRFLSGQLKVYHTAPTLRPGLSLLRAGMVGIMLVISANLASAQQTTPKRVSGTEQNVINNATPDAGEKLEVSVKGVVKEFSGSPLPGTNIYIEGTTKGTVSDNIGHFEFPQKLRKGDVLVFSFIGFETMKYVVGSTANDLDIEMKFNDSELIMMGDVAVEGPQESPKGLRKIWSRMKRLL